MGTCRRRYCRINYCNDLEQKEKKYVLLIF